MSERERWVVYPLLFLTLGIAMRDKMLKRVETDNVVAEQVFSELNVSKSLRSEEVICKRLIIRSNDDRRTVAVIEENPNTRGGQVITLGPTNRISGAVPGASHRIIPWTSPNSARQSTKNKPLRKPKRKPKQNTPSKRPNKPRPVS